MTINFWLKFFCLYWPIENSVTYNSLGKNYIKHRNKKVNIIIAVFFAMEILFAKYTKSSQKNTPINSIWQNEIKLARLMFAHESSQILLYILERVCTSKSMQLMSSCHDIYCHNILRFIQLTLRQISNEMEKERNGQWDETK